MFNSKRVIESSNIMFGTSGVRGLISDFEPQVSAAFVHSFIDVMAKKFFFESVAIAIDNRPSSYEIAQVCAQAINKKGLKSIYYGIIPTPALANQALKDKLPAIMVTGSHISSDRNGLKFYRPDGEITKDDQLCILQNETFFNVQFPLPELVISPLAAQNYIERYVTLFSDDTLIGKRIGIYEHSSAGKDFYHKIFSKIGAKVIKIGHSNEFIPIDTEALTREDRLKAQKWSSTYNLDTIFSTDGDGDRPLVADENGEWIRGDILGFFCAKALYIEALAIPISCNSAIAKSSLFSHVQLTKIGSLHVIQAFTELSSKYRRIAGFEPNGGFLLGSDINFGKSKIAALPTRDAVLPFLITYVSAVRDGVSLSNLLNNLPSRFTSSDRIQNFPTELSKMILSHGFSNPISFIRSLGFSLGVKNIDNTDGIRITLDDDNIIQIRPSGNAPELRCYAESKTLKEADFLVEKILNQIKKTYNFISL